jgi:hypothetical protein
MAVTKWTALGVVLMGSLYATSASSAAAAPKKARTAVAEPRDEGDVDAPVAPPPPASPVPAKTGADVKATFEVKPSTATEEAEEERAREKADAEALAARGEGALALAFGTPADAPVAAGEGKATGLRIRPYLAATGGLKLDFFKGRPGEDKETRMSTLALGRLGIEARWGSLVSAESELMASGGIGLRGASAYEGQAALQVRQQVLRLHKDGFRVEVGRFIDEASADFFSAHVAETFLQDTATRDPLLFSGFNLGNGVRGAYQLFEGLRVALTFNAGNPVSTTSSLMIGGSFPPFERFYSQPYQAVAQGPNNFPDDSFHIMVLTPSVLVDTKYVDARVAFQGFDVDTNTGNSNNDTIRGYNVRGTVRAKLLQGLLVPFASAAYTRNDTLVANDLAKRASDRYQAVNIGGGLDLDVARRYRCAWDCADGFGAQLQQVQFQVGEGLVTTNRYVNVGGTFWLAPNVSLGARFAFWSTQQEYSAQTGERSGIVSLRFIMR